MKKLIVSAAVSAVLAGFLGLAWGQGTANPARTKAATPAAATQSIPHKVGLIDMAKVFKDYKKFETLREDLKNEIVQTDEKAKAMAQQLQALQAEMQNFKKDSPEFIDRETKIAKLSSEFETFRKVAQRDFLRKEAEIYKTVYLEALDVVEQAATAWNYTLVIRFNSEELDSEDPQKLIQGLNRQVVFHRTEDDITAPVIKYLNEKYERTAAGGAAKPSTTR